MPYKVRSFPRLDLKYNGHRNIKDIDSQFSFTVRIIIDRNKNSLLTSKFRVRLNSIEHKGSFHEIST